MELRWDGYFSTIKTFFNNTVSPSCHKQANAFADVTVKAMDLMADLPEEIQCHW